MKRVALFLALVAGWYTINAQVPQGFNYQAIARDNSGNPIKGATLQVKIGILSDTVLNTMVYEELFNPITTNAFGMFTLVVGTGVKQSGTVSSFSAINWTKTPLFMRTSVNYSGTWRVMGNSKLQSVPYSMVAGNLEGSVPYVSVAGNTTTMDSALFVVRNNTGQIIFAVYNEGVRIYVDDGVAKGTQKGGFAIGSFNKDKGTSYPLFIVDPDSIRAYIDTGLVKTRKGGFAIESFSTLKNPNQQYLTVSKDSIRIYIDNNLSPKARKGGFAIGSFNTSKGGSANYLNVSTESTGIINPSENRILWYPLKNAFLTGRVLIEAPDSVGINSFASGYESKAIGQYSQAMGYKAEARGSYSTAIGKYAVAGYDNSFAFGDSAMAMNEGSYAFGSSTKAMGIGSFAFGFPGHDSLGPTGINTTASAPISFAFGMGDRATEVGAFAFGANNEAAGMFSLALGFNSSAKNWAATALGEADTAMGRSSYAIGVGNLALGDYSYVVGFRSRATGFGAAAIAGYGVARGMASMVMGNATEAGNWTSFAIGDQTHSDGPSAFSGGYKSKTDSSAAYSFSFGQETHTSNSCAVAFGCKTVATGVGSVAMGVSNTASGVGSLAIGNYTNAVNANCLVTGYGNVGLSNSLFEIGAGTWTPNGPSARANVLTVLMSGNVGLGVLNPDFRLQLPNTADWSGQGIANAWVTYSDARVKSNIQPVPYGIDVILKLQPEMYLHHSAEFVNDSLRLGSGSLSIGLCAQELYNVIPEAVTRPEDDSKTLWGVDYSKLIPILIKGMQQQQQQIESYKSRLQTLQEEVAQIKDMLARGGK